ncbi:hypothetical protein AAF712_006393 [Marasmius tenuissimus]|uniref:Uncharacterized protein n=1 Tax=Marasmius tenuissimus TaxID=585030 RepID=A0ABR2ZZ87_9AGAR
MKSLVLGLAASLAAVARAQISIARPYAAALRGYLCLLVVTSYHGFSLIQCESSLMIWFEGLGTSFHAPAHLFDSPTTTQSLTHSFLPQSLEFSSEHSATANSDGSSLMTITDFNTNIYNWTVRARVGISVTVSVRDSKGETGSSPSLRVNPGGKTC